jgi:hypothetical protein
MKLHRIALLAMAAALFATEPTDATKRWWAHTVALANDSMEGRDTGSPGYQRAERYVTTQFERAGLKPAGEKGYTQAVPLHVTKLRTDQSTVELVRGDGVKKLEWLRQITTAARPNLPESIEGELVFLGDGPAAGATPLSAQGKIVVQMPARAGAAGAGAGRGAGRGAAGGQARSGSVGSIAIDTTGGAEPPRWPVSYSVAMRLAEAPQQQQAGGAGIAFRFNPKFAEELFQGSGHTYAELLKLSEEGKPLPQFEIPAKLRATFKVESSESMW